MLGGLPLTGGGGGLPLTGGGGGLPLPSLGGGGHRRLTTKSFQPIEVEVGAIRDDDESVSALGEEYLNAGLKFAWMDVVTIDKTFQIPVPDIYKFLENSPTHARFVEILAEFVPEEIGITEKEDHSAVLMIPVKLYLDCTGDLFQNLMMWLQTKTALPSHISRVAAQKFGEKYGLSKLAGATDISIEFARSSQSLNLSNVTFQKTLEGMEYSNMVVDGSVLTSSDLTEVTWNMVSIRDSTLDHNDFSGSRMVCVNMSGSTLTSTKWRKATLESCNMSFCRASMGAEFEEAKICNCHFDHSRLQHGKFAGCPGKRMTVTGSSFQGAFFSAFLFDSVEFLSTSFRDAHIELSQHSQTKEKNCMSDVGMCRCDVSGMILSCSQKDKFGRITMQKCRVDDENEPLRILDFAVSGEMHFLECDLPGTIIQGMCPQTSPSSKVTIGDETNMSGSTFLKVVLEPLDLGPTALFDDVKISHSEFIGGVWQTKFGQNLRVQHTRFEKVIFDSFSAPRSRFLNVTFNEVLFKKVKLSECKFVNCTFVNCILNGPVFDSALMLNCKFSGCKILSSSDAGMSSLSSDAGISSLSNAVFEGCEMSRCLWTAESSSKMCDVRFKECTFKGPNMFKGAWEMGGSDWRGCDFLDTVFDGVHIGKSTFVQCRFRPSLRPNLSHFRGCILRGMAMWGCVLQKFIVCSRDGIANVGGSSMELNSCLLGKVEINGMEFRGGISIVGCTLASSLSICKCKTPNLYVRDLSGCGNVSITGGDVTTCVITDTKLIRDSCKLHLDLKGAHLVRIEHSMLKSLETTSSVYVGGSLIESTIGPIVSIASIVLRREEPEAHKYSSIVRARTETSGVTNLALMWPGMTIPSFNKAVCRFHQPCEVGSRWDPDDMHENLSNVKNPYIVLRGSDHVVGVFFKDMTWGNGERVIESTIRVMSIREKRVETLPSRANSQVCIEERVLNGKVFEIKDVLILEVEGAGTQDALVTLRCHADFPKLPSEMTVKVISAFQCE